MHASMAILTPSDNFTRPANTTAYADGDLVANSTTAASVTALSLKVTEDRGNGFLVRRARLRKSGTTTTNASFRVHLYKTSPTTISNGDNDAWSTSGVADYLGGINVTIDEAFTDGAHGTGTPRNGNEIIAEIATSGTIYALIEATAAYTPASAEVFTLTLEVIPQ